MTISAPVIGHPMNSLKNPTQLMANFISGISHLMSGAMEWITSSDDYIRSSYSSSDE